jgi:hypothetical protein
MKIHVVIFWIVTPCSAGEFEKRVLRKIFGAKRKEVT